jgi:hypothetical protein
VVDGAACGDLREGGVVITALRRSYTEWCSVCGRADQLWHAWMKLPEPIADHLPMPPGCTREHAVAAAPISWAQVSEALTRHAADLHAGAFRDHRFAQLGRLRIKQAKAAASLTGRRGDADEEKSEDR